LLLCYFASKLLHGVLGVQVITGGFPALQRAPAMGALIIVVGDRAHLDVNGAG